ncbi:hypothetical protein [Edaphobacter flagellatus]|uniref:hypothetical protein n=1 Tax=Edaphobacter flagellatus TaxID=1933044 RepID=UPI0021B49265|nr:hypothetical protein [Edaphobacter flagellatus]
MGGAYPVRALLEGGALGFAIALAVALMVAGTLIRRESRRRFLLWCAGIYITGWMLFVLYNTVLLTRYFLKVMH